MLVSASLYDIRYRKVKRIFYPILCLIFMLKQLKIMEEDVSVATKNIGTDLIFSLLVFLFFLVMSVMTDCMGGGDIKFIFFNNMVLGFNAAFASLIICFAGIGSYGLINKRRRNRGNDRGIPLIPFLAVGSTISLIPNIFIR